MEVRISGNRVGPQIIYPGSPNDLARILKSFGEGSPNSLGIIYLTPSLPKGADPLCH